MDGLVDVAPHRSEGYDPTATTGETTGAESHLDSFFRGSKWTREDVLVVVSVLQALVVVATAIGVVTQT